MIWCVEDDASIRDIEVLRPATPRALPREGFADGAAFWEALREAIGRSWWCWT